MDTFPSAVNEQLPQLADLHKVYVECSATNESTPAEAQSATAQAVAQLGNNPTLLQVAAWLGGRIDEVKKGQGVLAGTVAHNTKDIELQKRQIKWLHQKSADKFLEVDNKLREVDVTLEELKVEKVKQYKLTCEIKQRSVKGNFILSGPHVPKFSPSESIYDIVARILWDKYQIGLDWYQMRAMHRLPGGNIILAIGNRMPGSAFQSLMAAANSNPNPQIRAYINLQLMEPFNTLHYTARKLKALKLISFYKLDENGYTWIAVSENKYSFKFTALQQLAQVGVTIPPHLLEELKATNDRKSNQEREMEVKNLERAAQERPVTVTHRVNTFAASGVRTSDSANNTAPVRNHPANGANARTPGQRPSPTRTTVQTHTASLPPPTHPPPTHPPPGLAQPPPTQPPPRSGHYSATSPTQTPGSSRLSPGRGFPPGHVTESYRFPDNINLDQPSMTETANRAMNFGRDSSLNNISADMGEGTFS